MKVERQISWWDRETLIDEVNIDHIPIEELKALIQPPPEDSLMYHQYEVNQTQVEGFSQWVELAFNFELYSYLVECWPLT